MIDFIFLGDLDRSDDHLKEYVGKASKVCKQQHDENCQGTEAGLSLVTVMENGRHTVCLQAVGEREPAANTVQGSVMVHRGTAVHVW